MNKKKQEKKDRKCFYHLRSKKEACSCSKATKFEGKTTIILNSQAIPPPTKWIYQFKTTAIDERLQK